MGYPSQWSVRAGTPVEFMVSARAASFQAEIIRVTGRGPRRAGDGPPLSFERVHSPADGSYPAAVQQTVSGSYGVAGGLEPSPSGEGSLWAWIYPTLPAAGRWQSVLTWLGPDGQPALALGLGPAGGRRAAVPQPGRLTWRARGRARRAGRPAVALRGGQRAARRRRDRHAVQPLSPADRRPATVVSLAAPDLAAAPLGTGAVRRRAQPRSRCARRVTSVDRWQLQRQGRRARALPSALDADGLRAGRPRRSRPAGWPTWSWSTPPRAGDWAQLVRPGAGLAGAARRVRGGLVSRR